MHSSSACINELMVLSCELMMYHITRGGVLLELERTEGSTRASKQHGRQLKCQTAAAELGNVTT
jgi:hypothetical protein